MHVNGPGPDGDPRAVRFSTYWLGWSLHFRAIGNYTEESNIFAFVRTEVDISIQDWKISVWLFVERGESISQLDLWGHFQVQ